MKIVTIRNFYLGYIFPALLVLMMVSSCSLTRTVEDGDLLLNKVRVDIPEKNLRSDVTSLIKQKENRKILWIYRFKLRFYNSFIFKKDSETKLRLGLGEVPVIYDSLSAENSVRMINAFLKNKGYYKNEVSFSGKIKGRKKKKIVVTYKVKPKKPTIIAEINLDIADPNIKRNVAEHMNKSLLKVGDNFDIDKLEKERSRIANVMQNEAYFFFSNDLLYYHADTIREKYKVFLTYRIKENPVKYFGDSIPINPYKTYRMHNVYVRQDFDESFSKIHEGDTVGKWGYFFLNESSFTVKPKVISRSIFHQSGDFYKLDNHESTYRRLSALNNFKYINITYEKAAIDTMPNYLDCFISLSPSKPKSFSIETNGTTTGGILGINGTVSVSHRNTFRGAELLRLSVYGGLEAQATKDNTKVVNNTPFNTIEFGPEISLVLPKFLLPFDQNNFSKRNIPKTTLTFSYNYQNRPDYIRNIINGGLIYSWKESKTKSHAIQPLSLSQIKILKSDDFKKRLDSLGNSSLNASYEDNFIASISYNFVYNDQVINKESTYNIFRGNVELAGNGIYLLDEYAFNTVPDENQQYRINNIPYAQYFRTYVEFINNYTINHANHFVSRIFAGAGIPYKNSTAMPFVKSFYSGGTNGIRAWQARSLGPGSVSNEDLAIANVDQIGDLKGEINLEYRFGIIKYLEAALFSDMGNIWVLKNENFGENASLQTSKLWKDLAIGTGIGLRLNFDYFVVRFDVAKRMKDPGAEDPYAIKIFYPQSPVYNFAIGYPF